MSASPLNPLPISTTPPATGNPPPVASGGALQPFPQPTALIPIGKIALPEWPGAPSFFRVEHAPIAESPQIDPLPSPPQFPSIFPANPFQPVTEPAASPAREITPDPVDPPATAWVPAPEPIPPAAPAKESSSIRTPVFPPPSAPLPEPDFTDEDLREALAPLLKGLESPAVGERLEPMLRATVRRALAEYSPASTRPFQPPNALDRFRWRMQALLSSRTYEDIFFEKTHRFQVEEVFLVDAGTLALISYASANPGRHASTRRVEATVKRIALQARTPEGQLKESFKLSDNRNVFTQKGNFVTLLALFRGNPDEMAVNDLSYALDNIEARFCERFRDHSLPLLKVLQPFLEDCLLIQSPAAAA